MLIQGQKRRTFAAISWRTPCAQSRLVQPAEPLSLFARVAVYSRSEILELAPAPCSLLWPERPLWSHKLRLRPRSARDLGEVHDIRRTPLSRIACPQARHERA
ncbi:hypothetical protein OBBRIDRAFT_547745 [Obba rivulosa]|uniref:Uncharacterized protein n=1 Tax=Obba rivulosa TaxID=1052685 RepID=A0A8E2DK82_9APHY|nr:hypothetical protein OBBRIDRAFT_547745 [Obba rivulosa]